MKRICVYVICLLACCLALCAQAENWDAEMPEEYAALLTEYAEGLQGDEEVRDAYESVWTGYQCCLNAGIDPLENVGYVLTDLNEDGVPELVFGEMPEAEMLEGIVYELLTLRGGQPVSVIRGWERYRVALMYDEQTDRYGYYAEGSSSAFDSVYETGLASKDMEAWDEPHVLEANSDMDSPDVHWTLDGEEISADEAEALVDQWRIQRIELTLRPMNEYSAPAQAK